MPGDAKALAALRMPSEIHLPLIVLGELLGGFAAGTRGPANREKLAAFLATLRVRLMPLDEKTASSLSDLGRRKRKSAPARTVFAGFAGP